MVKGKGNYAAVLAVSPGSAIRTTQETWTLIIANFWKSSRLDDKKICEKSCYHDDVLNGIEEVSIDLWKPYKSLVTELMPNAEVVAERFHVTGK